MQPTGRLQAKLSRNDYASSQLPSTQSVPVKRSSGIGSLAGGILGGIAGTALGPLGTIGGGAAGSALGEALDELITTGRLSPEDIGREGTIGLAGGVAGKALGLGVKGLRAAKGVSVLGKSGSLEQAVMDAAPKTSFGGKLMDAGNKALAEQYGTISKPVARQTRFPEAIGQLADAGLVKPQDVEQVASKITGANGVLSKAVRNAAGSAGRVPTDGLERIVSDAITENGVVGNEAKSLMNVTRAQLQKLAGGAKGSLTPGADPNDALEVMKNLEKRIANLEGRGGNQRLTTPERQDQANVLRLLHGELEDRLYNTAGANSNIQKVLTPELRNELVSLAPGNKQWASHVDNTIMQSKDVGSLRSAMAPFVRASKGINEADLNSQTFGGRVGNQFSKSGLLQSLLESAPVKRAQGQTLRSAAAGNGIGSKVSGVATSPLVQVPTQQLGARGVVGAMTPQTSPEAPQSSSLEQAVLDATQSTPDTPTASQGSVFTPEMLQALAINDIQNTGGKNLDKIATLDKLFGSGSVKAQKPLSAEASKQVANAQSGLDAIDQLSSMLKKDSSLPVKDLAPGALGRRLTGAGEYEAAKQEIIDVLARLRTGAAISKQEEARFKAQLPQAGDSPDTVAAKLRRYETLFNRILASQQQGSPDLESLM